MLTTPAQYRIRVQGYLSPEWAAWFAGLTLSWQEPDQTILSGQVIDQAALHGILNTIRDLGLPLLEVRHLEPEESETAEPGVRKKGANEHELHEI
jgi:hypothetical protein